MRDDTSPPSQHSDAPSRRPPEPVTPHEGLKQSQGRPSDYLANERTFLAWLRTGVALIALGFVVARFGLLLRELQARGTAQGSASSEHISSIFGTTIVILSATLLALSYARYRSNARALERGEFRNSEWLTAVLTIIVILVALALAIYLLITA